MVYIHLATGFEEVEALTVVDVLRRAEIQAKTVSVTDSRAVAGNHGISVLTDLLFEEADYDSCEMIVLPGGLPGASNLGAHVGLRDRIIEFAKADRPDKKVAAICAAPMILADCGILEGRKATIYPGMEKYLGNAEATEESVVVSGNIITGRGPAFAMAFALTLVEELGGKALRDEVAAGLLYEG